MPDATFPADHTEEWRRMIYYHLAEMIKTNQISNVQKEVETFLKERKKITAREKIFVKKKSCYLLFKAILFQYYVMLEIR